MATRQVRSEPQPANLSAEQKRSAIPILERRIAELTNFNPDAIKRRDDPSIEAIEKKLETTINGIFGPGTIEANQFMPYGLDRAGINMVYETPLREVIQSIRDSIEREIANLHTIIELFREQLADGEESPATKARRAFGDLNLHPAIAKACTKLFEDGHYANAVETACKVLEFQVKAHSIKDDASGTDLMQVVFSAKKPILKFNEQRDDSERSEQQGMMYLYAGAMAAIRNPRAHGLIDDHPEQAIEYLMFINMLTKALDRTTLA